MSRWREWGLGLAVVVLGATFTGASLADPPRNPPAVHPLPPHPNPTPHPTMPPIHHIQLGNVHVVPHGAVDHAAVQQHAVKTRPAPGPRMVATTRKPPMGHADHIAALQTHMASQPKPTGPSPHAAHVTGIKTLHVQRTQQMQGRPIFHTLPPTTTHVSARPLPRPLPPNHVQPPTPPAPHPTPTPPGGGHTIQ